MLVNGSRQVNDSDGFNGCDGHGSPRIRRATDHHGHDGPRITTDTTGHGSPRILRATDHHRYYGPRITADTTGQGSPRIRRATDSHRFNGPWYAQDVRIHLNGEPHDLAAPVTVAALLEQLGIDSRRVAVEHNLTVVRRGDYDKTMVEEADEVEIVNFVGGGSR
jgi:sulfur carrier protein